MTDLDYVEKAARDALERSRAVLPNLHPARMALALLVDGLVQTVKERTALRDAPEK